MTNTTVVPVKLQLDLSDLQTGVTALKGLDTVSKKISTEMVQTITKGSRESVSMVHDFENLVTAIQNATAALIDLTSVLENQGSGSTVFDVLATAISGLSLACDVEGSAIVKGFLAKIGYSVTDFVKGIPQLFKILAGAAGPVTSISEAFYVAFGTGGSIVAGIVAVIGGAILAVTNFFSMLSEGFNWLNEILMLVGIALLAVGAIVLGAPVGIAVVVANIVAAVGTAIALVLTYGEEIKAGLNSFSEWLKNVFCKDWTEVFGISIGTQLNLFVGIVSGALSGLKEMLFGLIDFIQGIFTADWSKAWAGVEGIFKGVINGIIGIVNGMISAVVSGINAVFRALSFNIDLPDGRNIGWNLPQFTAYQIPLLAQGAVLPANRPFLAVVGDQKHGTNVEAPLSTIQAAVADVLARQSTGDINITFTGDLAQLGRVLKPVIERENRRVGGSLAKGVY